MGRHISSESDSLYQRLRQAKTFKLRTQEQREWKIYKLSKFKALCRELRTQIGMSLPRHNVYKQ